MSDVTQQEARSGEITNLVMVPDNFKNFEALEKTLKSIEAHDGFLFMNRSSSVMSPQGPTGYNQIIEIHWKSMDLMMDWATKNRNYPPVEEGDLKGLKILFYDYR